MVKVLVATPNNKVHNLSGLSCNKISAKWWQMEQSFVLRVNTKSWVSFRLVNISRFEHVAFRLKPTICRVFLSKLPTISILVQQITIFFLTSDFKVNLHATRSNR